MCSLTIFYKPSRHDTTEILLKVALNTNQLKTVIFYKSYFFVQYQLDRHISNIAEIKSLITPDIIKYVSSLSD